MKTKLCLFLLQQIINFFLFFTAPLLFRLAAERGEDQREEHLPEAEEALVRADP